MREALGSIPSVFTYCVAAQQLPVPRVFFFARATDALGNSAPQDTPPGRQWSAHHMPLACAKMLAGGAMQSH